ncbi:MAG TPA: MBL fold metallo-hydrolase [Alphaproteobacteria bacterium]|nr:MBL fold metallo-hydrolase [Alphaproteobacteria bacterium]
MLFGTPIARSYRGLFAASILAAGGLWSIAPAAFAQHQVESIDAEAAKADISVQPLRGNVTMLVGSGGNISVLTGADGKLLVDGGIAVSRKKIEAALAAISNAPVKYLINTHWHWDHTDGNAWLHQAGATIIAHENTLKDLSGTIRVAEWRHTFTPVTRDALPTVLVRDRKTLKFDSTTISIKYYGLSHTNGDISVFYKEPNILQTGDTWWNGYYPMIDYAAGGSIDGMIRAANENISLAHDDTIVIPGHGPVGNRAQLIAYRDMLVAIRANVAKLKKQGKNLAETIAAKPTADFDAAWGGFVIDPALFTELVYRGV